MAEPIVEGTSTYLRKEDWGGFMEQIAVVLEPRIKGIVQEALDQQSLKFQQSLAEAKGEIRGEMEAKLQAHKEDERLQRQKAIDDIQVQVRNFGEDTTKKLGEINNSVDHSKQLVQEMSQTVSLFSSEMKGWTNTLSANQQSHVKIHSDIDRLEEEAKISGQAQVVLTERTDTLHRAIFGSPGHDGPLSLYASIEEVKLLLIPSMELARSSAARIDAIEQAQQQEKERWTRRWSAAKSLGKGAAKTPYFWAVIAIAIVMFVAIFRPEALPAFIEFVLKLLGAQP